MYIKYSGWKILKRAAGRPKLTSKDNIVYWLCDMWFSWQWIYYCCPGFGTVWSGREVPTVWRTSLPLISGALFCYIFNFSFVKFEFPRRWLQRVTYFLQVTPCSLINFTSVWEEHIAFTFRYLKLVHNRFLPHPLQLSITLSFDSIGPYQIPGRTPNTLRFFIFSSVCPSKCHNLNLN
jgi:hypothetical protein